MTQVAEGTSTALEEAVSNAAVGAGKPGPTMQSEVRSLEEEITKAIPATTGLTAERFTRILFSEMRKTPMLLECTRESFLGAMMQTAQLGLEIGSTLGQAYLIPYRDRKRGVVECQLQIGYKGYIELAYRGGIIMEAREVYANDEFSFDFASEPPFHHGWKLGKPRGEIIGFYGTAKLPDGRIKFHVMDLEEIERRRQRAQSKDNGPWKTDYTAMCRKTVIRAMVPQTPMSTELSSAIKVDDATITRDAAGDLKVSYQEAPENIPGLSQAPHGDTSEELRLAILDDLNAIEPNEERLKCSRHLDERFGGTLDEVSSDVLPEFARVVKGWPATKISLVVPKADQKTGEVIDAQSTDPQKPVEGSVTPGDEETPTEAPGGAQAALDEILAGLPEEARSAALDALEAHFGEEFNGDAEQVLAYLEEWLEEDPEEESPEGALFASAPVKADVQPPPKGGSGVPQELIDHTKLVVGTWDKDHCDQFLRQFGLPVSGSLEAKRLKLVVHLAPLRHAKDPVASELF